MLAGIMASPKAPAAARVAAAQALLDRGWGKAPQAITAELSTNYVVRLPEPVSSMEEWQRIYADPLRRNDRG